MTEGGGGFFGDGEGVAEVIEEFFVGRGWGGEWVVGGWAEEGGVGGLKPAIPCYNRGLVNVAQNDR